MNFPEILADTRPAQNGFSAKVPDRWLQGRTAYGGLSAALAYEAARMADTGLPPLRSAQISFVGPLSGEIDVTATLLRRGRNAAFVRAEVSTPEGVGLAATFVFMRALDSAIELKTEAPPPDNAAPAEPLSKTPSVAPAFMSMFDMGPITPPPGGGAADMMGWLRLKDRGDLDPMTELLLVGDGLPPAALMLMEKRVPLSSLTWIVNMLTPQPAADDGWWLLRSTSDHVERGSTSQDMSIWNSRGQLVARGMQSIALFG